VNSITFVIPHYQSFDTLAMLLQSIDRELEDDEAEGREHAILVDDATPSSTSRLDDLEELYPWLVVVRNASNRGPAHSRNVGARRASSNWVWFVDSDVCLESGALVRMQKVVAEFDDASGIISGVGLRPTSSDAFQKYKNYVEYCWQPKDGRTVMLDSKSCMVRRKCFLEVGGFDENFREPTVEDYDLGYRFLDAGKALYYTQKVKIVHHHPDFARQWRAFYKRTQAWVRLKSVYGFSFDDNGTSSREALMQGINISVIATLAMSLRAPGLLFLSALLTVAWFAVNLRFVRTALGNGESPVFLARSFAYAVCLSIPVWAGLCVGTTRVWRQRSGEKGSDRHVVHDREGEV
jgi:GT2 family glycosyltransferase